MNPLVAEARIAEVFRVLWSDLPGRSGQGDRVVEQRALAGWNVDGLRAGLEPGKEIVVFGDLTERLPVMADSVVAVVLDGHGDRDHLALPAR